MVSDSKWWHWQDQAGQIREATTCHLMPINTLRDSRARGHRHSMMRNHISVHQKIRRRRRETNRSEQWNKDQCHRSDATAVVASSRTSEEAQRQAEELQKGPVMPRATVECRVCVQALHSSCQLTTFSRTILASLIADYAIYFACRCFYCCR